MSFLEVNEILREVSDRMPFKESTEEKDIVLLITDKTMVWGYVNKIEEIKEEDKNLVIIKILSIPPLEIHLRLNKDQIDGNRSFGLDRQTNVVFMKAIDFESIIGGPIEEIYIKEDLKDDGFLENTDNLIIEGTDSIN